MTNVYSFTVNQSHLRLDHYLAQQLPDYSRSKIQNFIKQGQVTINGETGKPSQILKGNETVECHFDYDTVDESIIPEQMSLDICYEDDHLVVINKPAGSVVHPGSGNHTGTLLNGLVYHFQQLSREDSLRPGIVHRLDKDTSGVILVAKNNQSHDQLAKQFNERRVKKEYMALVWGELEAQGIIEGEIGRHPRNRQIFTVVPSGGRNSFTRFERLEYFAPLSLVNLHPETGRTHQLRVHMKSINHPIFGDKAYGGGAQYAKSYHVKYTKLINRLINTIPRVSLHARRLEISHPVTGEKMSFTSPIPTDFNNATEILKHAQS